MHTRSRYRTNYRSVYRSQRPQSGWQRWLGTYGRMIYFPFLFVWLEVIMRLNMSLSGKYFLIWSIFGFAAGCLITAFTTPFSRKVNLIVAEVYSIAFTLAYLIEMFCKKILQTYYPISILGVASENKMEDYVEVVVTTVLKNIPIVLVMFLPTVLLFIFGARYLKFARLSWKFSAVMGGAVVVLHLLGLLMVHMPWKGDVTPAELYKTDTAIEDQVDQLGLLNMLRLDVKHMIIPVEKDLDDDFGTDPQIPVDVRETDTGSESETATESETGSEPGTESETESESEPEVVIDRSPNVMNVDLASLAEKSSSEKVQWLAKYFNSKTPTNKNEYTGMFEGYNVIFFTIEGFSVYGVSEELTPTLYKLMNSGFVFNNFYTPLHYTSTSGGECQNLLGLYPKDGNPISMKETGVQKTDCYFSLAQQLKREGYQVIGFHGNGNMYGRLESHTNLGYDWRQYQHGLTLEMNNAGTKPLWPQRDKYVVEASVDEYINSDKPFHVYYMTISGHMPYSSNYVTRQYRDMVDPLPYTETTQNYLTTIIEVDKAMEYLLQRLEEAGKLDKTVIVAAADHVPYFDVATLEELTGKTFGSSADLEYLKEQNINTDVYRNMLILWSGSMKEPVVVNKVCGQVDILPTLSNLLGLEYDSRMLSGTDILSESEGLVVFHSKSWLTDRGFYNRYTQEFTPAPGVNMTDAEIEEYVSAMKTKVKNILECTELIIQTDFYHKAL
ncbi:MAG: LTA synthase family protein, partial [Clostridia bacterium]|nr:LTA synthase family protein [Clostridia bacterium]